MQLTGDDAERFVLRAFKQVDDVVGEPGLLTWAAVVHFAAHEGEV